MTRARLKHYDPRGALDFTLSRRKRPPYSVRTTPTMGICVTPVLSLPWRRGDAPGNRGPPCPGLTVRFLAETSGREPIRSKKNVVIVLPERRNR
jgi:hypothetical protein